MPCRTESIEEIRGYEAQEENKKLSAALCAIFTSMEAVGSGNLQYLLDRLDYREAGIGRKWLTEWWVEHKEEDRKRRLREKAKRDKEQLVATAKAKLTEEERIALGIK